MIRRGFFATLIAAPTVAMADIQEPKSSLFQWHEIPLVSVDGSFTDLEYGDLKGKRYARFHFVCKATPWLLSLPLGAQHPEGLLDKIFKEREYVPVSNGFRRLSSTIVLVRCEETGRVDIYYLAIEHPIKERK